MSVFPAGAKNLLKSHFVRISSQDFPLRRSATSTVLCSDCARGVPWSAGPFCLHCVKDTGQQIESLAITLVLREVCATGRLHFDRTIAAFRHNFPIYSLSQAYKFRANLVLIATLTTERFADHSFIQVALLGRLFAKRLESAFSVDGLWRVHETRPQIGLKRHERLKNACRAFKSVGNLVGKPIPFADDTMKTGVTMSDIAKALKQNEAIDVEAGSVARAIIIANSP